MLQGLGKVSLDANADFVFNWIVQIVHVVTKFACVSDRFIAY